MEQELVVLTFWQTKEDMNTFYNTDNKTFTRIVDNLKPSFEQTPERIDYEVSNFKIE